MQYIINESHLIYQRLNSWIKLRLLNRYSLNNCYLQLHKITNMRIEKCTSQNRCWCFFKQECTWYVSETKDHRLIMCVHMTLRTEHNVCCERLSLTCDLMNKIPRKKRSPRWWWVVITKGNEGSHFCMTSYWKFIVPYWWGFISQKFCEM